MLFAEMVDIHPDAIYWWTAEVATILAASLITGVLVWRSSKKRQPNGDSTK